MKFKFTFIKFLILKPNTVFFKNYYFPSAIIEWKKIRPQSTKM